MCWAQVGLEGWFGGRVEGPGKGGTVEGSGGWAP